MLPLPTEFEDSRFRYTQVERTDDLAIFTQTHKASGRQRYEVVMIRVQKEHTWPNGTTTPEKEAYPGSTSWGRLGQTCYTLAEAQAVAETWRVQRTVAADSADDEDEPGEASEEDEDIPL